MRSIISTFTALLLVLPAITGCDPDDGSDDGSNDTGNSSNGDGNSNNDGGNSNNDGGNSNNDGGNSNNDDGNSNNDDGNSDNDDGDSSDSSDSSDMEDEVEAWFCACTYDCDGIAEVWDADALCLSDEEAQLVVDVAAEECLAEFEDVCEALECDCECEVDAEFTCE